MANERRKKAAAEAEKELEKQRAEVMAKESAQLSALEEKRNLARGNPCRKCKAPLKPGALFCTKCGEKFEVEDVFVLFCFVSLKTPEINA